MSVLRASVFEVPVTVLPNQVSLCSTSNFNIMSDASTNVSDASRSASPVPSDTSASTVPSVELVKPLEAITDDDRAAAASIKAQANKAFQGL